MAARSRSQTAPRRTGREEGKERASEVEFQKVCKMLLQEQSQGLGLGFFLLRVLGPVKRRGISITLCCAAPPIQRAGGFVASFAPYFAFKIFKAPQKALRGSLKVWKSSDRKSVV